LFIFFGQLEGQQPFLTFIDLHTADLGDFNRQYLGIFNVNFHLLFYLTYKEVGIWKGISCSAVVSTTANLILILLFMEKKEKIK
jgi:hypothetical protein